MLFTREQLGSMLVNNGHIDEWYDAMEVILEPYEINTPERIAAFLAQCSHESQNFTALSENLNYRPEGLMAVFGKYFPTLELAKQYCSKPNKQEAIANRVYANRMGNGNEYSGDGYRYRGRGVIQLTGKNNYLRFSQFINMPLDQVCHYLETFKGALESACWFWRINNLNDIADNGDMVTLTKRINGGTKGLEDRVNKYEKYLDILVNQNG